MRAPKPGLLVTAARASGLALTLAALGGTATAQATGAPAVGPARSDALVVQVPENAGGTRTFRVSVPWAPGARLRSGALRVGQDRAPSVPLLRWPDGSIRLEQAHVRLGLEPGRHRVEVAPAASPPLGAPEWAFDGVDWLRTELEDPFGRRYEARFEDVTGASERARSTSRIRVRRLRGHHLRRADDGVDEVYLPVDALLVEWSDTPRVELTLVLRNDALGDGSDPLEPVLGPVRLREFTLVGVGPGLRALPHFGGALRMRGAERGEEGVRLPLLGPNESLYLGDRTRKAFRIDLVTTEGQADSAIDSARTAVEEPWFAIPGLEFVRATGAFGTFGGPAPLLSSEEGATNTQSTLRVASAQLGRQPFGSFGEPKDALRYGRLRCGPTALHQVLRVESGELLRLAELAVLQHGLRPGPGRLREPEATQAFRQGIPERLRRRPHGYTPLDYEHLAHALLFDRFWLTGDPFARDELIRLAGAAAELWRTTPMRTSRGEGRVAIVLATVASLDLVPESVPEALLDWVDAFRVETAPRLDRNRCIAFAQPPSDRVLGPLEAFDAPWQIAELIRGLAMARRYLDPKRAAVLVRAQGELALALAGPGWDREIGAPKTFVSARDPALHFTAGASGPASDTGILLIGAFAASLDVVGSGSERRTLVARADQLLGGESARRDPVRRADRWLQAPLDREPGPR